MYMYEAKRRMEENGYSFERNENKREKWMDFADNLISKYSKKKIYRIISCATVDDYSELSSKDRQLAIRLNIAFQNDIPVNLFIDYIEKEFEKRSIIKQIKSSINLLLSSLFNGKTKEM